MKRGTLKFNFQVDENNPQDPASAFGFAYPATFLNVKLDEAGIAELNGLYKKIVDLFVQHGLDRPKTGP